MCKKIAKLKNESIITFGKKSKSGYSDTQASKTTFEDMMPKFYAGEFNPDPQSRGFFLVLSDVSDTFKLADNTKGLTGLQLSTSLKQIAHFHALSFAYGVKHGINYKKEFPIVYQNFLQDPAMTESCERNFKLFIQDLKAFEDHQPLIKALENLSGNYKARFRESLLFEDGRFLSHGDFWANNVMFAEGNECRVKPGLQRVARRIWQ